jgi:hypothetical protein
MTNIVMPFGREGKSAKIPGTIPAAPLILSLSLSLFTIDPIAKPAYDRLAPREQTELRWGARAVVIGDAPGKRVFGRSVFSFEFRSDITVYVEDRPDEIRIVHIILGR